LRMLDEQDPARQVLPLTRMALLSV
jgi:hypothetical protein